MAPLTLAVRLPPRRADRAAARLSSTLPRMNALTSHASHRDPGFQQVLTIARRYCERIEAAGPAAPAWLAEVAELLPRLHAAMTSVQDQAHRGAPVGAVDLDARFDLYSRLRGLLADRDGYFLEFDRAQEGPDARSGSLADDLTDIYCELKAGLRVFEVDPQRALETWFLGYEGHWSQHLVDAERHLVMLAAADRLGLP